MPDHVILAAADLPFEPRHWERIKAAAQPDTLVVVDPHDRARMAELLQQAEIAIINHDLGDEHIAAPKLKWVHCNHAGLTKSARPEVFAKGMIVTGSAGRSGQALAEHVIMFSLLLCSRYADRYEAQKRHHWQKDLAGMDDLRALYGRTIGILGMGYTGRALATRAKAFEMRVLGYRRRDEPAAGVDKMYSADSGDTIDPILEQADILALVLNLSDATYHLIDDRAIRLMKKGAIIVNLARGGIIDTQALMAALNEGRLAGAGLDVTDPEPLPPDHPLWDTPNVLITPHFTAALPDKVDRCVDVIVENFKRYRAGTPMVNQMTREDLWSGPVR